MKLPSLNHRPRLAVALQLALLMLAFQGVVATTPTVSPGYEATSAPRTADAPSAPSPRWPG